MYKLFLLFFLFDRMKIKYDPKLFIYTLTLKELINHICYHRKTLIDSLFAFLENILVDFESSISAIVIQLKLLSTFCLSIKHLLFRQMFCFN